MSGPLHRRGLSLLAAVLALPPLAGQVTEEPLDRTSVAPAPSNQESEVDLEREKAALAEIDAYVAGRKGRTPKDPDEARAWFEQYRDDLLELERKHHGTWAGWQALMTVGQIQSRVLDRPEEGVETYGRVWQGVRGRTDQPIPGVFLNVPRVGLRYAEALIRLDRLDEAEAVLREVAGTELPERTRILERLRELPELRRLVPGTPAPEFEAVDFSGRTQSLSAYRGQVVLVFFWSAINGPSLSLIPQVKELVAAYAASGLRVLSVNVDPHVTREDQERLKAQGQHFLPRLFSADDLKKAIARHGVTWPVIWDGKGMEGPLPRLFTVKAPPGAYLIGRDGRIVGRNLHGRRLRAAVEAALKAKAD
ncbi:MAG: TlpA family protein disulfide reductase [Planctomycetota bacterium]|nr:MAG: TlpA family protein disulfide reductase [Planctomycetota bacterium]